MQVLVLILFQSQDFVIAKCVYGFFVHCQVTIDPFVSVFQFGTKSVLWQMLCCMQ